MANIIPISSIDDPRIAPYTRLKERDLSDEGRRFIAEGEPLVRRLIASRLQTESILAAESRFERIAPDVPSDTTVYIAPADVVNRIIGFKFHSGIMAVGRRPADLSLSGLASSWTDQPVTLVICPEIANTDNLGSLIRISAAFGATAMILGERCCDPFYRQSVRVSMGAVFQLPIIQSTRLLADLAQLRDVHQVELIATVLDNSAEPLPESRRPRRIGLLFGNEAQGLRPEEIAACQRRVTLPMQLDTDSLNVSVAAGVFLYHFTHVCGEVVR